MSSMKQDNVLKSAIKSTFKTDDFQMLMVKLHKTYCDPRNVDKMDLVQNTIKETKIIIKEDIKKTLGMKEELLVRTIDLKLQSLEERAARIRDKADEFEEGGKNLKSVSGWANTKMNLVIGGTIATALAGGLYFFLR